MYNITFDNFPYFVYAHYFSIDTYEFNNRYYDFLEIAYITEGALEMTLDGEKYCAMPGDCIVIFPGTIASCKVSDISGKHSHLSVGVRGNILIEQKDFMDNSNNKLSFFTTHHQKLAKPEAFENLFKKLITAFNHNHILEATGIYFQLCNSLQKDAHNAEINTMSIIYSKKIIDYIQNNLTERITIPELAKYLSITPEYASSVFKSITKETIINYVNKLRIKKAKELMERGGISIEYAAIMVGIHNTAYFSRLFKKLEGIPPSEYKNSIQRKFIKY